MNNASILDTLSKQDYEAVVQRLNLFLKDYLSASQCKGVVIGLSGGLDSSVAAAVCAKSLGAGKVYGLIMPTKATPKKDIDDALSLARSLNIDHKTVRLDGLISKFASILPASKDKKAMGNLTSRTRALVVYYFAGIKSYLVSGTSDRSEILIGYFTKFGDGSADIQPIGSLFKTQVRALGRHLGTPKTILEKKSSPRLWSKHLAEKEIGIDYETIDSVLYLLIDQNLPQAEICSQLSTSPAIVQKIKNMVDSSVHKRLMPPVPKLL